MEGDRIERLLDRARRFYGPPWPPALARYLEDPQRGITAQVIEELEFLEAVLEVTWPGKQSVFRSGL